MNRPHDTNSRALGRFLPGRLPIVLAILIAVGVGIASAGIAARGGARSGSLNQVSATGRPIDLSPDDLQVLRRVHQQGAAVELLAVRAGRSYYRIGTDCYAAGPAQAAPYRFGGVTCSGDFPSAQRPVLDFSVFHGNPAATDITIWRTEGIASDGVAAVGFRTADGRIVGRAAVTGNTYFNPSAVAGNIRDLLAFNAAGDVVDSQAVR